MRKLLQTKKFSFSEWKTNIIPLTKYTYSLLHEMQSKYSNKPWTNLTKRTNLNAQIDISITDSYYCALQGSCKQFPPCSPTSIHALSHPPKNHIRWCSFFCLYLSVIEPPPLNQHVHHPECTFLPVRCSLRRCCCPDCGVVCPGHYEFRICCQHRRGRGRQDDSVSILSTQASSSLGVTVIHMHTWFHWLGCIDVVTVLEQDPYGHYGPGAIHHGGEWRYDDDGWEGQHRSTNRPSTLVFRLNLVTRLWLRFHMLELWFAASFWLAE